MQKKVPLHFISGIEEDLRKPTKKLDDLLKLCGDNPKYANKIQKLQLEIWRIERKVYGNLSSYQRVQLARHINRPHTTDYLENIFSDFMELHGDRKFGDDPAIVAGFARFEGKTVAVLGHEKGRSLLEVRNRNGGQPNPEGYRKAMRVMETANRWRVPIITLIDTPGAYPGIGAEERNQAGAIADSIYFMFSLTVPVIVIIIGEGGSGGALAIGIGNRVLMMENAIYSVISPEGGAAILFKDGNKRDVVAKELRLTAREIYALKKDIIDEVISEPRYAHLCWQETFGNVKGTISRQLRELAKMLPEELRDDRLRKFRRMGIFNEWR